MLEQQARVKQVVDNQAILELQQQSACQSCQMSGACGTSSLARLIGFKPRPLTIENRYNLKAGDLVTVGIEENAMLVAGLLTYLLPLLALFVFALIVDLLFAGNNLLTTLAALAGLLLGFRFSAWVSRQRLGERLQPRVIRLQVMNQ